MATRKIFVGGLSANVTEVEFRSYFEKFGCITDVVIMYDSTTHRPRGFGFITFNTEEAVENVMQKSFHELNKKVVEVKRAVPKDGSHNNGNSYSGHGNSRASGERVAYGNYQPFIYPPYDPRYGYFYGYAPPPVPSYAFGTFGYGGGYTYGSYGGIGYNAAYPSPRGTWSGQGGMMATRKSPVSYPNGGFYTGYANKGSGGYIGLPAGGYHGAVWSSNGKFNQTGTDLQLSEFESKKPSEFDNVKVDDTQ